MYNKKIIFTDEQLNKILELHSLGMKDADIANIFGVSKGTIGRRLRELGIIGRHPELTEGRKNSVIKLYKKGMSMNAISKHLKISTHTVSNIINNIDGLKRNLSESSMKYDYNYNYFSEIDSEKKAYFLGLLYADGCIGDNHNIMTISLQEDDKNVLEVFKNELNYPAKLKYKNYSMKNSNWKNQYCLSVVNKKIHDDLIRHGVVNRKSHCLKFPDTLDEKYLKMFILGYSDGDGSILKTECRYKITSTINFCESLKNILEEKLNIHCSIIKYKNNITCDLQIAGRKQVKKYLDWLYSWHEICLERKYYIYKSKYCCA